MRETLRTITVIREDLKIFLLEAPTLEKAEIISRLNDKWQLNLDSIFIQRFGEDYRQKLRGEK